MFETLLIKAIQGFISYFSNPENELPLTYHSELINGYSASEGKRLLSSIQSTTYYGPPHDIKPTPGGWS
jgi:hypothetical protein